MPKNAIEPGNGVVYRGRVWLVTELVEAVGGAQVAQIESLDDDAFAAVAVASPDLQPEPLTKKKIVELRKAREAAMAPRRARNETRLARKVLRRLNDERDLALSRGDTARAEVLGARITKHISRYPQIAEKGGSA